MNRDIFVFIASGNIAQFFRRLGYDIYRLVFELRRQNAATCIPNRCISRYLLLHQHFVAWTAEANPFFLQHGLLARLQTWQEEGFKYAFSHLGASAELDNRT